MSKLTILAYNGMSRINDPQGELSRARGVRFATYYPGGRYGEAEIIIPRKLFDGWELNGSTRLDFYYGLKPVYQGWIENIEHVLDGNSPYARIPLVGAWGRFLMRRRLSKPWADRRISEDVWVWDETRNGAPKCSLDRDNRIQFTPKSIRNAAGAEVGWLSNEIAIVRYTAPTGQTIKRLWFDFAVAGAGWTLGINNGAGTPLWSQVGTGSGVDQDIALGANAHQVVNIYLQNTSGGTVVPATDGTVYARISDLTVYTETGNIDPTEIIKDLAGYNSAISTDLTGIGSNTLATVPFIADWSMTHADIASQIAGYGDASYLPWAFYLGDCDAGGKPVPYFEQQPSLSDYDITGRMEEFDASKSLTRDFSDIWNWIIVQYTDELGQTKYVTPDDDANLKDAASIAEYGQRDYVLTYNTTRWGFAHGAQATAVSHGRTLLAAKKDPVWKLISPITIKGQVRTKAGDYKAACEVRAGMRVRIENVIPAPVFLINQTDYSEDGDTNQVTAGVPDIMALFNARTASDSFR